MFIRCLVIIALLCNPVLANELVLKVTPFEKITTSDEKLQEGDYVTFKVLNTVNDKIKEGDKITGIVTYYEPNGFLGKEAMISIENFVTDNNIKLKGAIFAKGNQHNQIMEFKDVSILFSLLPINLFRGGEVHFYPNEDIFLLYMEN